MWSKCHAEWWISVDYKSGRLIVQMLGVSPTPEWSVEPLLQYILPAPDTAMNLKKRSLVLEHGKYSDNAPPIWHCSVFFPKKFKEIFWKVHNPVYICVGSKWPLTNMRREFPASPPSISGVADIVKLQSPWGLTPFTPLNDTRFILTATCDINY